MTDRRRSWRTEIALECLLHRRTGKTIEAQTLDLGPGGMRVKTNRPLAVDETFDFELPGRARIRLLLVLPCMHVCWGWGCLLGLVVRNRGAASTLTGR